jgi:SAM-dependent methyltransferase
MSGEDDYWKYAFEVFKTLTAPFRPEPAEIAFMERAVRSRLPRHAAPEEARALLLGVTAEITGMRWPGAVELTAVDQSSAMIEGFWPGDVPGRRRLVRGDWLHFPAEPRSFRFVLGDGVFNIPGYPEGYAELARRAAGLLRPDGVMIVRVFTQPDVKERTEAVVAEIRERPSFDYWPMRFRFVTSLQEDVRRGILGGPLPTIRYLAEHGIDNADFVAKTSYRPVPLPAQLPAGLEGLRINFPTRGEFVAAVAEHFRVVEIGCGKHELAERCPVYCLAPLA